MRLAVTCDWFLKYASSQSAALARAGAEVLLLCRTHAAEFGGDVDERLRTLEAARDAGVTIFEIPGRHSDPRAALSIPALRRRVRAFAPQLVHAHEGVDPRALALIGRTPKVLTIHDLIPHPGQPVAPLRKRWLLSSSRAIWRARASLIIVHSEALRPLVRLRGQQRCEVLPHGIEALREALPPPSEPTVAFFGRMTEYKGLDVLARAMPRVWQVRPDVRLLVTGDGPSPLEISDPRAVIERRYLPEDEFGRFFARASLGVLPYTEASASGAGGVAIGHGVPIVVSRVGGLPDLALDQSYVVEPGDDAALAHAIVAHVDDGTEVRARVLTELARPMTWDTLALRSIGLYEELLESTRRSRPR